MHNRGSSDDQVARVTHSVVDGRGEVQPQCGGWERRSPTTVWWMGDEVRPQCGGWERKSPITVWWMGEEK